LENIDDNNSIFRQSLSTLCHILSIKGNHDEEVKLTLERILAMSLKSEGADCVGIMRASENLAVFNCKISVNLFDDHDLRVKQLHIANSYCENAIRISIKIHGSTHPNTLKCESLISTILTFLNGFSEL
jgi:hypothetical protein